MSSHDNLIATATTAFEAARRGWVREPPRRLELLYFHRRGQPWSVMGLPECKDTAHRPDALRVLARLNSATSYFHISEAVRQRTEGGVLQGEEAVLVGLLATPDGDAMFLAPLTDAEVAAEVVGDLVEGGAPLFGDLAGTMRPVRPSQEFH